MIFLVVLSFSISAVTVFLVIRLARRHARRYAHDMPQRFHVGHVPRIGGVGIFAGLALAWAYAGTPQAAPLNVDWQANSVFLWLLLMSMAPAVLAGIVEDMTQRLRARLRLGLTALSAVLLAWLLGLGVDRVGLGLLDGWLQATPWAAALFAVVAIAGLPHAFNLIDGYNGLAGMVAILVSLAIMHVALQVGDRQLAGMLACLVGATGGFLLWNYPYGKIFAGDGGAYVWGFVIAVACVLLVQRHPLVSPWFPMLVLMYPVGETLFSIYRKLARGQSPGTADALHLHQLIFRRIVRVVLEDGEAEEMLARNNRTSPYLWMFAALSVVPAVMFWHNTRVLFVFCLLFAFSYVCAYLAIIRFKVPRWLRK
ncbi:glycosyltransferase family 4 protein [Pseudorhodoferax sp.]|uniref:glycosyltransferase family 4 protein n=1 Tax=Pseudorhodoferax sp. TaxID=1993553 RepID=UPI0039E342DA